MILLISTCSGCPGKRRRSFVDDRWHHQDRQQFDNILAGESALHTCRHHMRRTDFRPQTEFATQLLSVLSLVFTKLSIVFFYRRVFRGKTFSLVSIGLITLICIWGVAFFFATLFECMPISEAWKSLYGTPEHSQYCYNYLPMFQATAVTNMIIDVLVLTVPIPLVWRLQMPIRQKIAVSGFFLLGALSVYRSTKLMFLLLTLALVSSGSALREYTFSTNHRLTMPMLWMSLVSLTQRTKG